MDWREAFERMSNFSAYPEHSTAVRQVVVHDVSEGVVTSSWKVKLRRGILVWTERAYLRPEEGTIRFEEIEGDVDKFIGSWKVEPAEGGCSAEFVVDFEIGIPTLEDVLEPIAEEALVENVESILNGLLGETVEIDASTSHHDW
jgi:ribosome-associated toxin RatA of RatAB toxin-antitoxin module